MNAAELALGVDSSIPPQTKKRYGTVRQASQTYPAFTQSSFRWLIFNEETNGFSKCVRRVGRKVLIDFDAFEDWMDEQQAAA